MLKPRPGVVCTRGRRLGSPAAADSYLLAARRKATWFDGDEEHSTWTQGGAGTLFAAVAGEGQDVDAALTAATSVARVLVKRWNSAPPDDPEQALVAFLGRAHERMYWKTREREDELAASVAVGWWIDKTLYWAEVGDTRVYLWRDGNLHRLSRPWRGGSRQRMLGGSAGLGDDTHIHFKPGVNHGTVTLRAGDRVMLATAGLWEGVEEASLLQLLSHVDDPQTAAVSAMERAVARGGVSPVTTIVVDHEEIDSVHDVTDPGGRAPADAVIEPPVTTASEGGSLADEGVLHLEPPPRRRR